MKNNIFLFVLAVLMSMASTKAYAYDIAVENEDGKRIYYNFINGHKEKELEVTRYIAYNGDIVIPETVVYAGKTYKVTRLKDEAFKGDYLTSVVIPNSVRSIGEKAFLNCTKLQSATLPNNLQVISRGMFEGCSSLISIDIPSSVKTIGSDAFSGCSKLESVSFPTALVNIDSYAFDGCSSLTSIKLPESVVCIGSRAFYGTGWLSSQPDGLVYIGKVAYKYKGEMPQNTHLKIKEGTIGIAGSAFSDINGLISITIPNTVKHIGAYAFDGCTNLRTIDIPESVVSIGGNAFGSKRLDPSKSYTAWYNNQPEGLVYAGKVAYKYKGTMSVDTEITLKEGTLGIADWAFQYEKNLTSITIPQSVISIGKSAFSECI